MRSKCITTWPMPSGPVRKPEMLRPGLNGSLVVSAPLENFQSIAGGVVEHNQIRHVPLVGERPRSARDLGAGSLDPRRDGVERGAIRHLPAEESDALSAVGVDHESLLAVIH